MSRYNSRGQFLSGNGGPISINSSVIAGVGTLAQWKDDDHVIANTPSPVTGLWALCLYDTRTGQWTEADARGANFLAAGGGRYAAQLAGQQIHGDISDPMACLTLTGTDGRGSASRDGTIATTRDASRLGLQLRPTDGSVFDVPNAHICRDVYVVDRNRVIWRDDVGTIHGHGISAGRVAGPAERPIYIEEPNGTAWLVYFTAKWGVVAHPLNQPELGRVVFTGNAFHHDACLWAGGLWVGASIGVGELPGEERGVNVFTLPITDLTQEAPLDPIVPLNRDHYLSYFVGYPGAQGGWDTNDDPSSAPLPANGWLVTPDGYFTDVNDVRLGEFIHGGANVEEVESHAWAIAPSGRIPIAYWDARAWPRWPNLPGMSWLCLQAYCGKDESLPAFEADIRARINDPTRPQLPLVLVAQAFTSNASLTKNIEALVPIFSRLAAETPSMIMTLVFNGNGRSTGLQHNQHVLPLWQQYFAGITGAPHQGEPSVPTPPPDNGIVNGVCVNPENYFMSLVWDKPPSDYRVIFENIKNDLWLYGIGFQTRTPAPGDDLGEPTSRLYLPCSSCPNAAPDTPEDQRYGVRQVPACWDGSIADTIENDASGNPIKWTWTFRGPEAYQAISPPIPEPEPGGPVKVLIHEHPTTVKRSDWKGLPIFFEAESGRPIVEIVASLNDGEPTVPLMFLPEQRRHGVYCRGFAYKPVKNGTFTLTVTAKDDQGNVGQAVSPAMVTVVE